MNSCAPGFGGALKIARRWPLHPGALGDVQSRFHVAPAAPSHPSWFTQALTTSFGDGGLVSEVYGAAPHRLNSSSVPAVSGANAGSLFAAMPRTRFVE
jgi:hypothetical protein